MRTLVVDKQRLVGLKLVIKLKNSETIPKLGKNLFNSFFFKPQNHFYAHAFIFRKKKQLSLQNCSCLSIT